MDRKPTGNRVKITGINIERVSRGRIVEHWSSPDTLALFRQLGMIPGAGG
jgi:predicted ester cyclase